MKENLNANSQNSMSAVNGAQAGSSRSRRIKQRLILLSALIACLAILATGTLAYFTAQETSHNVITTGLLSMRLVEETSGGEPWPEAGISGVVPGLDVEKVPYVVNDGEVAFYTRASVELKVTNADGEALSDEYITLDYNLADWTEKDGFYYYNADVLPEAVTAPLFTKVYFAKEMDNAYMHATVEINIKADAVQSKNNGDSALTALGWAE